MLSTDIPRKFTAAFASAAAAGTIRPIPAGSQVGGAASLADGFSSLNFQPVASGGVPPFGQDMNGVLNQSTGWDRWYSAGGAILWDGAFSAAVGGYPRGAVVASPAYFGQYWISLVEGNTTNPDTGGAGWQLTPVGLASNLGSLSGNATLTLADRGKLIQLAPNVTVNVPAAPPIGMLLSFYANGAATINNGIFYGGGLVGATSVAMIPGDSLSMMFTSPNWVILARNSSISSVNGRGGSVTLLSSDVTGALGFTPVRQGGYGAMLNNNISLGWDGVGAILAAVDNNTSVIGALASQQWVGRFYAPLLSPVLAGNPQTPTPPFGATAQIANTAYINGYYAPITLPSFNGVISGNAGLNAGGPVNTTTLSASVSVAAPTISAATVVNFSTSLGYYAAFINSTNGNHTLAHVQLQWFQDWNPGNGDTSWTGMAGGTANRYMTLAGGGSLSVFYPPYAPGGGAWNAISDARVKDVHGPYDTGLAAILALAPQIYTYRGNDGQVGESPHHAVVGKPYIGLIAQDAESAMPELVTRGPGLIDGIEVDDFRSINSGPLVYALINAVKELAARCELLEARLTERRPSPE